MVPFIKDHTKTESQMATENIYGKMGKFIKVNGPMDLKMAPAYGEVLKETHILDNGRMEKLMGMEFTHG